MSLLTFSLFVVASGLVSGFLAYLQYQVHHSGFWAAVTWILATVELTTIAVITSAFVQFFA